MRPNLFHIKWSESLISDRIVQQQVLFNIWNHQDGKRSEENGKWSYEVSLSRSDQFSPRWAVSVNFTNYRHIPLSESSTSKLQCEFPLWREDRIANDRYPTFWQTSLLLSSSGMPHLLILHETKLMRLHLRIHRNELACNHISWLSIYQNSIMPSKQVRVLPFRTLITAHWLLLGSIQVSPSLTTYPAKGQARRRQLTYPQHKHLHESGA